jgi:serine/threonine protein kinase
VDPRRPDPRTGAMTELEAKLLAAGVAKRLFNKQADPVELGRYRVLERLGQGGMGVVFRAHDPQLRRDVALKLLHARGGVGREQQARLRREALALGRLSHPNVVQVFEVGEVDEHMFVVMELVRGTTLRAWLGERVRGVAEVVAIAGQVGRGLAAAHAAGIVHRDLKPENVLVGEDGRARVVDFGLARAMDGGAAVGVPAGSLEQPLTNTGTLLGTPAFMAPEQVRDPTRADARSDQFSFCVLMYEALYGERPFVERGGAEVGEIRAAPAGSTVPAQLRAALLRGLRGEPAARWPTMEALIAAIEAPVVVVAPRRWPGVVGGGDRDGRGDRGRGADVALA